MSERSLWKTVRHCLAPYLQLTRVENRADPGTPDVAWAGLGAEGWLELKHLAAWPRRAGTPVVVPRLTLAQVLWAERRFASGGDVRTLLRVSGEGYALLGPHATRMLYERRLDRAALTEVADVWAAGAFPTVAVLRALTDRAPALLGGRSLGVSRLSGLGWGPRLRTLGDAPRRFSAGR